MVYRFLADVVMVVHAALLVFFLIGGFLAWRWRRLIWVHLSIAVWNLSIVILDFGCPVTALEKELRRNGGEQPYEGGFIQHYVDGTVYPQGYTWLAEKIGFALLVISYVGFFVLRRRSSKRALSGTRDGSVDTRT
ncbi:MAG: hypothetical protein QOF10_696 [Kribbellaceae bacterium]|nr:hypothetical protein [Kribbellaceae bacterium]